MSINLDYIARKSDLLNVSWLCNKEFFMFRVIYRLICFFGITANAIAADYYVATNGNDTSSGSIEFPLLSLDEAVSRMDAGDTCYLRGGRYRQSITLSNKDDLEFRAYAEENVVMDGTVPLDLSWTNHTSNIFKASVDEDFWQLFAGDKMMMPARWPNARLDDLSVWNQNDNWAKVIYSSSKTDFTDDPTAHSNLETLGYSVQGAIAVMNVGSFKSYAREILTHDANSSDFTVSAVGNRKASNYQYYFLEGLLDFIDSPEEWYLDQDNNILYAWGDTNVVWYGKTSDYAFDFTNCDNITISDINFFATTVRFSGCLGGTVQNSQFLYPSCTKRMSGISGDEPDMTAFIGGGNHAFYNNTMRYADTPAVYMTSGSNNRIENCLFEYIDWSSADLPSLMMTVYMRGTGSIFQGNTAHTTGASAFLDVNSAVQAFSNEVWHTGLVQNDGSVVQLTIGAQPNSETAYNWFFDNEKYGARFDASTAPGSPTGSNGLMHHNVGYNINAAIMQKGDDHQCINNTSFDNSNNGIIILSDNVSTNNGTIVRNNAAERMGSHRKNNVPLTDVMDHSHNWNGYDYASADIRTVLRDPDNLDFRPKPYSVLIDGGKVEGIITSGYIGSAPDIGAYEAGDSFYWIPGRKEEIASRPIPPNQAQNVKSSAALMWRKSLNSQSSYVYFGTDSNAVTEAGTTSSEYKGSYVNNMYDPLGLDGGTYYWRIDESIEGVIKKGDVWSFTVENSVNVPPSLSTSASVLDATSAQLNLTTSDDIASLLVLEWWEENGSSNIVQIGSWAGSYSHNLYNLDANKTYLFRYSASNSFGSVWSDVLSFQTDNTSSNTNSSSENLIFYDYFDAEYIGLPPNSSNWNSQITLNDGDIQIIQQGEDIFCRLYNPNTGSSGARTVLSAIDAFSAQSLITVSYDSYFAGDVNPSGSFFLGAGIGSLASHHNQIRKVSVRTYSETDVWNHFDWIVNQTGSNITYQVGTSVYSITEGAFDLWRNGELIVSNSTEKASNTQNTPLDETTPITAIGFSANKNDTVNWYIDDLEVRDTAYVESNVSPYAQWAASHGVQAATNDWDGDGIINLVEYGVGSGPRDALDGPQRLPYLTVEESQIDFIYHRRNTSNSDDLNYILESSPDLTTNDWNVWNPIVKGSESLDNTIQRVTNDIGNITSQQFFRLRMELSN